MSETQNNKKVIWNHFVKDMFERRAECNYCKKNLSYKSTVTNLKQHLRLKHKSAYNICVAQCAESVPLKAILGSPTTTDKSTQVNTKTETDGDFESSGVWNYFETEAGGRARCVVCQCTTSNNLTELKEHLKRYHPKLVPWAEDSNSHTDDNDASSHHEEDPIKEVVYVEEENTHDRKPNVKNLKRKRRVSSSEDEIVDKNHELTTFIKYISCLMRSLPNDVSSKVQVEIVNLIMAAKLKSEQPKPESVATQHNYSINMIPDGSEAIVTTPVPTI